MDSKFIELAVAIDNVCNILNKIESYNKECNNKLSDCDKLITDLQHCLELEKLSASQIVQLGVKERDTLIERRQIKDELDYIRAITDADKQLQRTVERLLAIKEAYLKQDQTTKEKRYIPRIDKSLFTKTNIADKPNKPLKYVDYKGRTRTIKGKYKTSLEEKFEIIAQEKLAQK